MSLGHLKRPKPQSPRRLPDPTPANRPVPGRLPHGSEYRKYWDAERQLWTVLLYVGPATDQPRLGFEAVASKSFTAEAKADAAYRRWLREQAAKEAGNR